MEKDKKTAIGGSKVDKNKLESQKRSKVEYFSLLLVIFLICYLSIWLIQKNRITTLINNLSINVDKGSPLEKIISIDKKSYDGIKIKLSPYGADSVVQNLSIIFRSNEMDYNLSVEKLSIRKLFFGKKITLWFDGIRISSKNYDALLELKDYNINVVLDRNSKPKTMNFEAKKIDIREELDDNSEMVRTLIGGVLFKTVNINTKNYINTTIKVNIDSIISLYREQRLESNFEFVYSFMKDLDSTGKVNSVEMELDNMTYNDITNNFGITLNGDYKYSSTGAAHAIFDGRILNYNSLVSAINRKNSRFMIKKESLSNLVQALKLVPSNGADTIHDKHYTFVMDMANKKTTINGVDFNDFLRSLLGNY